MCTGRAALFCPWPHLQTETLLTQFPRVAFVPEPPVKTPAGVDFLFYFIFYSHRSSCCPAFSLTISISAEGYAGDRTQSSNLCKENLCHQNAPWLMLLFWCTALPFEYLGFAVEWSEVEFCGGKKHRHTHARHALPHGPPAAQQKHALVKAQTGRSKHMKATFTRIGASQTHHKYVSNIHIQNLW